MRNSEFGIRNPKPIIPSEIYNPQSELESGFIHSALRTPHSAQGSLGSFHSELRTPNPELGSSGSFQSASRHAPRGVHGSPVPNKVEGAVESGSFCSELRTPNSELLSLRVFPGSDAHFCPEIVRLVEEGEIETVNDNGRFLMVEFPSQGIPFRAEDVLFQLIVKRITPIITHPERNLEIGQNPRRYSEMIKMGCLGQVTAMSLTGGFGLEVKRVAENLLRHNLIHFIASDAHSANGRPPMLSSAVKAAAKIAGEEEARKMVTEYPRAILEGKRPKVPEPKAIK
jgi:protein-tyrosine phosphatase